MALSDAILSASVLASTATESEDLTGVAGWAVDLIERLGAPGAGLAIALENLFPPLPSEIILPLAGFTASQGSMSLIAAIVWTTIGSVAGAYALYALGVLFGRERLRFLVDKAPLMKLSDVDRAEAFFERHGAKAVFLGRMVPIFRSLISIPAGVQRMPLLKFGLLTAAGSLIWNSIFVIAGYKLGNEWHRVEDYAGILQYAVIAIVLIAGVSMLVLRIRSNRAEAAASSS